MRADNVREANLGSKIISLSLGAESYWIIWSGALAQHFVMK